jgi:hypothetical protein
MAGFVLADVRFIALPGPMGNGAGDRTKAHGKENPPNFCAVPIRVLSARQLPTDHHYAVSTRGY